MTVAGGLFAQAGMATETTFNTPVTVTRFLEFDNETIKRTIGRLESAGLHTGSRLVREKQYVPGREAASGDVEFDVNTNGFGLVFGHMLGAAPAKSQPNVGSFPTVFNYEATVGAMDGRSFTLQIGRGDTGGTIRAFTYAGCKVPKWELVIDENGFLKLKLGIIGASETLTEGLAAASFSASAVPLAYTGGVFKMAGVELPVKKFSLAADNHLAMDRYAMKASGSQQMRQQLEGQGRRDYTGKITTEFESLVQYERFVKNEIGELVCTFSGPKIEGTYNNEVKVTLPAVRYDGETPVVPGPQLLDIPLSFKVLDSGAAKGPVQILYQTNDAGE